MAKQTDQYSGGKDLRKDIVNHISDNRIKYEVRNKKCTIYNCLIQITNCMKHLYMYIPNHII